MAEKQKTLYVCSACGATQTKWSGQCRECGEWNTMEEEIKSFGGTKEKTLSLTEEFSEAVKLCEIREETLFGERHETGIGELDRALGGGIVRGSVALISGEPGIGKSTLLLQICKEMEKLRVLYVSGEESPLQIKMRAKRLGALRDNIFLHCETDIDGILAETERLSPDILIIDSVQTMQDRSLSASPGSSSQVKLQPFSALSTTGIP